MGDTIKLKENILLVATIALWGHNQELNGTAAGKQKSNKQAIYIIQMEKKIKSGSSIEPPRLE